MRSIPRRFHRTVPTLLSYAALAASSLSTFAQADEEKAPQKDAAPAVAADKDKDKEERSPWLLAPVFNVNPKVGTALGAIVGYMHYFDEKSRPSMFGFTGQYTSTESIIAGAFARISCDEDHQRAIIGVMYGNIKNDYDDYLGSGVPLKNNAEMRSLLGRYTYRVKDDWFAGVQGIYQNFAIEGQTPFDDEILDIVGVQPFKSAGLGLVIQNDSRDSEGMPTRGLFLNLNNMAFRESLGGQSDYDVYRLEFRYFIPHGERNVVALRLLNHLAGNAPPAARAPVQLRGYKMGEYTGKYMSSIEGEERYRLAEKWTATVFAGMAGLYGDDKSLSDRENLYGAAGGGVQYVLKVKEGIVLNLEYAIGKDGNYGVYMKLGYAY